VKSHTSSAIAKVLIAVGYVTLCAGTGNADQNSLRAQAEAELARVTMDVDSANIMYSPADNGLGRSFMKVEEYQQEYLTGRESFQEGKYVEALQDLHKADDIIRAQPNWTEVH
jgi:hypothetical protein